MFSWFSFLTYAIVTAVTPGPNNIMSMSNASRKGFHRALPFNLGRFFHRDDIVHNILLYALCADSKNQNANAGHRRCLYALSCVGNTPQF